MSDDTYYDKGLGGGRNTLDARRFWEAAQDERLLVQQCGSCSEYVFPPQDCCPYCWAEKLAWTEVVGDGRLHSFSTVEIDIHSTWGDRVPYTLGIIELDEGVFMVSAIMDCEPTDLEIGTPVEVTFDEVPGEDGLFPLFQPL